jgi:hypothetical protein
MNVFQQLVNKKIKSVTEKDLMNYGKNYHLSLTNDQAKKVIALLKTKQNLNIFNEKERKQLLREIAKATNLTIARQLNKLFTTFTK